MEYERFKECTFKPVLNNQTDFEDRQQMYESNVNTQVKGMEQFLRKKQYEKKLKEEKKKREADVFDFAGKYDRKKSQRGKRTVPQPFNLSKAPNKFKEKYMRPELK
jgi:superoxide dismutase